MHMQGIEGGLSLLVQGAAGELEGKMDEQENSSLKGNAKYHLDERAQHNAKATVSWLICLSRDFGKAFRRGRNEIDLVVDSTMGAFSTTKRFTQRMVMRPKRDRNLSSSEEALLQELSFAVSECPDGDYTSLRDDVEFRQLEKQLHSLSRKVGGKAAAREEPRKEKTPEVSHEGPAEISPEALEGIPEKEDAPESAMAEKPKIAAPSRGKKETIPRKADVSMTKSRKPKKKWYSPMALADRANDGFLSVARSAGKTVRFVQSGTMGGFSKIKHALSRKKKEKKSKRQTEPVKEEFLAQDASPEADADVRRGGAPSPKNGEATGPPESRSEPVTEERPPPDEGMEQEGPRYPPLDLEAFLKQHSPRDKVEAMRLRKTLGDLLLGSEAARQSALKSLVGLRQVAEPFMVASLQTASPQLAEIALTGLSQIGSHRLIGCISDVYASSDPELRIVALRAAQRLTDEEARPLLERGLRDPDAKVKRRALSYLSWNDSPWALAEIRRLCNDPEPETKWAALEALLTVRPSEAYDNLELMMPSLDPAYRSRAISLLEQRKSLLNKDSTKEKKSKQPSRTRERKKERAPTDEAPDESTKDDILAALFEGESTDETPEESEGSPPGETDENDVD
jgi:hypothetical protein